MNESGVLERAAPTRPVKAQGTDVARATASICNAEWGRLGGMSGHGGFGRTFLALQPVDVLDELGGQRDGDACGVGHGSKSMTHNMITLNRAIIPAV